MENPDMRMRRRFSAATFSHDGAVRPAATSSGERALGMLAVPLLAACAIALAVPQAQAQTRSPAEGQDDGVSPPWEFYDLDKDGYISAEEARAQRMPAQVFRSLDVDRDGRLNREEFSVVPPLPAE